jgi:hypothetical protein
MRSSWIRIETLVLGASETPSISRPAWMTRSLAAAEDAQAKTAVAMAAPHQPPHNFLTAPLLQLC